MRNGRAHKGKPLSTILHRHNRHYSNEPPFEASMFVHFRERIGKDLVNKVNLCMIKIIREQMEDELEKQSPTSVEKNQGKLIIDATNGHQLSYRLKSFKSS